MSSQVQQQRNDQIKDDPNDQDNFTAPEINEQTQSQSGPGDREPPIEISKNREPEDESEGFIDESLLTGRDPNDTDVDDEALVLDGVSRDADIDVEEQAEDEEDEGEEETGDGAISSEDEEDGEMTQPNQANS